VVHAAEALNEFDSASCFIERPRRKRISDSCRYAGAAFDPPKEILVPTRKLGETNLASCPKRQVWLADHYTRHFDKKVLSFLQRPTEYGLGTVSRG